MTHKRFATLQAQAALQGVELRAIRNDLERWSFVVTAGAITQELATLAEVEAWLSTVPAQLAEGQGA